MDTFWKVSIGIALGATLMFAIFALDGLPNCPKEIIGAFLGASVAVVGAVFVSRYETMARAKEAREERERNLKAARAVLAFDLRSICQHAIDVSRILTTRGIGSGQDLTSPFPQIPFDIILRIKEFVQILGMKASSPLIELMIELSVLNARISSLTPQVALANFTEAQNSIIARPISPRQYSHDFDGACLSVSKIHVLASALLPYADFDEEQLASPPYERSHVRASLRRLHFENWLPNELPELIYRQLAKDA